MLDLDVTCTDLDPLLRQVTCFTIAKITCLLVQKSTNIDLDATCADLDPRSRQVLSLLASLVQKYKHRLARTSALSLFSLAAGTQFTCFTSTKVHALTCADLDPLSRQHTGAQQQLSEEEGIGASLAPGTQF